ncbi:MAG: hypothetical protein J5J00_12905 [Deltaproteobacteria bacterium]|nr:hypothetical protein [Deltaproteobacteria bacterium]
MKFTRFFKLRMAIANLDFQFVAKKIAELEERLTKHGQVIEPENTAVTQEGIFYIHPESGMAARVVLYKSDHPMQLESAPNKELYLTGYTGAKVIEKLNPYHLVRCNILTEEERKGWKTPYRLAQRTDGSFYYRFVKDTDQPLLERDIYQEIENQRLFICRNCFMKINSLVDGVSDLKRESFQLRYFFDVDFFGSWCRYGANSKEKGSLANIYPPDWEEIANIRKRQADYGCESCGIDLSDYRLRRYLYVHPTDHLKQKITYVKLQALCIACLADYPEREHFKNFPEYQEFLRFSHDGIIEDPETESYNEEDEPSIAISQILARHNHEADEL